MTPDEINRAIAEKLGWKDVRMEQLDRDHQNDRHDWPHGLRPGEVFSRSEVPDFCGSLDVMHEAEKVLDVDIHSGDSRRYAYAREVYRLTPKDQQPFRATAPQRAEAFLRVFGLWKEDEK